MRMLSLVVILLFLPLMVLSATGPTKESEKDIIDVLKENKKTMLEILDATAEQLGIKNVNDYELCQRWRELFYEIVRKKLTVDDEGWIYLGEEGGVGKYAKYDKNCNVLVREVEINASPSVDTSRAERAKEIPSPPATTATRWTAFGFIGFILVVLSSIFLLYGIADALMKKDLAQVGIRSLMFIVLVTIGYFLLKML